MNFKLCDAIELLTRTPLSIQSLLKDIPNSWIYNNEGKDTWSPYDVVGHLIHGELTDWIPRIKIILEGEDKRFVPFDRFAQLENDQSKSLEELLKYFSVLRSDNLNTLEKYKILPEQLLLKGIHPELGEVTLENLISAWVVHDMGHIAQISRVLAKNYKDKIGPWTAFLTIVN